VKKTHERKNKKSKPTDTSADPHQASSNNGNRMDDSEWPFVPLKKRKYDAVSTSTNDGTTEATDRSTKRLRQSCESERDAWDWIRRSKSSVLIRQELGYLLTICREQQWIGPARWICSVPQSPACSSSSSVCYSSGRFKPFQLGLPPSAFECGTLPESVLGPWLQHRPRRWFLLFLHTSSRSRIDEWAWHKSDWIQLFRKRCTKLHWKYLWTEMDAVDWAQFRQIAELLDHDLGKSFNESFCSFAMSSRWTPRPAVYEAVQLGFSDAQLPTLFSKSKWAFLVSRLATQQDTVEQLCMPQPSFRHFLCVTYYRQLPAQGKRWVSDWIDQHVLSISKAWLLKRWFKPKEYESKVNQANQRVIDACGLPKDLVRFLFSWITPA
jgi:hypothetical protein